VGTLGTTFDALLVRGAVLALGVAALWLAAVVLAVAVEARTGGRLRFAERTGCPRVLRLWLLALFIAMFAGVAPAQASEHRSRPEHDPRSATMLEGLQLPDRAEATTSPRVVVVRPGDTLWRIASDQLRHARSRSPVPTIAAVATEVARLHAANHDVIGPDPDLIRPGQRLTIPEET
jgi:nucleoid-associated protein YgaU